MSIPIITREPEAIEWFIQQGNLIPTETTPDVTTYFQYAHRQMHLHTAGNKIHLSSAELLPKDIRNHALYKLIQKRDRKNSCIVDCTGGLGRDSLIALYASENPVITFERNPCLALALLWLQRERPYGRWTIHSEDATHHHTKGGIWLIDPMFPAHPKMAKSQKRMQIIQNLVPADEDATGLITHAQSLAEHVFIKKPAWQKASSHLGLWSEVLLDK